MNSECRMTGDSDFESVVSAHYSSLYRFALSLVHEEAEAADLTQETFWVWATKGHQLRDMSKAKTWLFTTLHREFLQRRRRQVRFPHLEIDEAAEELPTVRPDTFSRADWTTVQRRLAQLDPAFQAPLALFYLQDHSYQEIAEILEIPLGTVKSRISRAIAQLQHSLADTRETAERANQVHHE